MLLRFCLVGLSVCWLAGCGSPTDSASAPQQDDIAMETKDGDETSSADEDSSTATESDDDGLAASIESGIAMLESEEYEKFLVTFFAPSELEAVKKSGDYDKFVAQFPRSNAPELLNALQSISGQEPEMSEDQKTAWFKTEKKLAGKNEIAFINIDGSWYIPNRPPER